MYTLYTGVQMKYLGITVTYHTTRGDEYSIKKRDGSVWLSKSFYIHDNGYKMSLFVYAAGENRKGTHLSVYLNLMEGPMMIS